MKKLLVLPCVLLALLAGCNEKKTQEQPTEKVTEVKTEIARMQDIEQLKEYTGTIMPFAKNSISSQNVVRIEKIMAEAGDHVKAGQLLVQMDPSAYLQAKLQVENLKVDYTRIKALFESGGVSKQQLDQLKTQMDVSEETVANLEKNTRLVSPINGIVTQRMFDNGDITGGKPILQVEQLNPLKIVIQAEEENFPYLKTGMPIEIRLDIYPNQVFSGRVNLVYPTIDPITHTFTVEINLENSKLLLRPGMFARVSLNYGSKKHVSVSDKAVIKQNGTNDRYVFVVNDDNTVSYKIIQLGQRLSDRYEILSGINDGSRVVTAGMSKLVDGAKVTMKD